jgi:pimeloyl-ACP methyl ester carboxylesterase
MERLALRYTVETFVLGGQSYGGLLAQAYLAYIPRTVEKLILSSSGLADYGKAWLPVEYAFIALVRFLPEKSVKNLLTGGLLKFITLPKAERLVWVEAIQSVMQNDLSRADVVSHFAVAADLIRKGFINPTAYHNWPGCVLVLIAEDDPTQSKKDIPRYEKLFGGSVEVVNMGTWVTPPLFDPEICFVFRTGSCSRRVVALLTLNDPRWSELQSNYGDGRVLNC